MTRQFPRGHRALVILLGGRGWTARLAPPDGFGGATARRRAIHHQSRVPVPAGSYRHRAGSHRACAGWLPAGVPGLDDEDHGQGKGGDQGLEDALPPPGEPGGDADENPRQVRAEYGQRGQRTRRPLVHPGQQPATGRPPAIDGSGSDIPAPEKNAHDRNTGGSPGIPCRDSGQRLRSGHNRLGGSSAARQRRPAAARPIARRGLAQAASSRRAGSPRGARVHADRGSSRTLTPQGVKVRPRW
jgi:hypothetical protein